VIVLDVEDDKLVKRLSGRRSCPNCGSVYNIYFDAPKKENICDRCSAELVQRHDDSRETVVRRLEVYKQQTEPIIEFYGKHHVPIYPIVGDRAIEEVQEEILSIIDL
jgi:adenylate kinase